MKTQHWRVPPKIHHFPRHLHSHRTTSLSVFGDAYARAVMRRTSVDSCHVFSLSIPLSETARSCDIHALRGSSFGASEKCQTSSSHVHPPSVPRSSLSVFIWLCRRFSRAVTVTLSTSRAGFSRFVSCDSARLQDADALASRVPLAIPMGHAGGHARDIAKKFISEGGLGPGPAEIQTRTGDSHSEHLSVYLRSQVW